MRALFQYFPHCHDQYRHKRYTPLHSPPTHALPSLSQVSNEAHNRLIEMDGCYEFDSRDHEVKGHGMQRTWIVTKSKAGVFRRKIGRRKDFAASALDEQHTSGISAGMGGEHMSSVLGVLSGPSQEGGGGETKETGGGDSFDETNTVKQSRAPSISGTASNRSTTASGSVDFSRPPTIDEGGADAEGVNMAGGMDVVNSRMGKKQDSFMF